MYRTELDDNDFKQVIETFVKKGKDIKPFVDGVLDKKRVLLICKTGIILEKIGKNISQNIYKLVDKHSELAVRTGNNASSAKAYKIPDYLHELKSWIKHNENLTNKANESKIKEGEKAI